MVFHIQELLKHAVDRMVIIRGKENRPFVKKGRYNGIDNGICLAGAGRPLNICHRVFHGVVDGKKLVQIDPLIDQGNGIFLQPPGAAQKVSEKGLDGHGSLSLVIPVYDCPVFTVQVQNHFHSQTDDIRHIVHACDLFCMPCHAVLDPLLIYLKIR